MINIFKEMDKRKPVLQMSRAKQAEQETAGVSEYILSKLMLVSDDIKNADVDALGYLEMLFFRVKDDKRIPAETRSLLNILDKLEEDLEFSVEIFGARASYILDFLEAELRYHYRLYYHQALVYKEFWQVLQTKLFVQILFWS